MKRLYAVVALGVVMLGGAALTGGGLSLVLEGLAVIILLSSITVFMVLAVFLKYVAKRIQIESSAGFLVLESVVKDHLELVSVALSDFRGMRSSQKHGLPVEFAHAVGRDRRPLAIGVEQSSALLRQHLTPSTTLPSVEIHGGGA